ncbi:MAG: leucyl aminopeptidase [Bacteroidetes bacterium]|nr:leucyl aminopeptidase [Bacteroidota bacterium]
MSLSYSPSYAQATCLVIFTYNELEPKFHVQNNELTTEIQDIINKLGLIGNKGECNYFYNKNQQLIILVGLGHSLKLDTYRLRVGIKKAIQQAQALNQKEVELILEDELINRFDIESVNRLVAETYHISHYQFNNYKSGSETKEPIKTLVSISDNYKNHEAFYEGQVLGDALKVSCDLINIPANDLYPETLAEKAQILGNEYGFETTIFNENQCAEMGMEALLAVGRASNNQPRFIVMKYYGKPESDKVIGVAGKGVTYDTGGLSLKPTDFMEHMKSDMGGSAFTIGAICALAKMKAKVNVIGVVAACENNVSANAYKPGDIIGSMSGKTIEVLNTDAEGRLTLADAVHYLVDTEKVDTVVNIATLTGAVRIALGDHRGGFITNQDELAPLVYSAASKTDEYMWQLPIDDVYRTHVDSEIADVKNTGIGRLSGTIAAACFVERFVQEKPWIHFDVSGVAFTKSGHEYYPKGATGRSMRTLYHLLKLLA